MINAKNIYAQLQGISDLLNREELSKEEKESSGDELPEQQRESTEYEEKPSDEASDVPSTSQTFETEVLPTSARLFTKEKWTQTSKTQGKRTVKTQTIMKATSTFFRPTAPVPVAVQPLGNEMVTDTSIPISSTEEKSHNVMTNVTPEQEERTEVEVERSSSEDSPYERVGKDIEFDPGEASSTDTEVEESSDDENPDSSVVLVEGKSPQDQMKFIVYEEAILELFGKCGQCGSRCIVTVENKIGSSCKICVSCTLESVHYFEWTTGPSLFKMPAFHLLLASGIIATGMESSKVLRLFKALNIPNVKRRELSYIQKNYAIPAVYEVWQAEQSARLREIEEESIVIASDMRVDSPGHTGLFGSGSTLDMKRNLILDTQIIKVI